MNKLVDQVNHAKNSMSRKHGYAPYQHVFGCDLRLPGSVHKTLGIVHGSALDSQVPAVVRTQGIRQAARRAFIKLDEDEKVRRALDHRSRPQRGPYHQGEYCYYLRAYPKWHGPGVVIGHQGESKIWPAVGSRVLKCAPEQFRRATPDQQAMLNAISPELIGRKRDQQGAHVYIDITGDGKPPEGDDGPDSEGQEPKRARREGPAREAEQGRRIGRRST